MATPAARSSGSNQRCAPHSLSLPHPVLTESQLIALRRLGYTYLYADGGLDPMVRLYCVFAPLVRAVVVDAPDAHACFRDPYCALRRELRACAVGDDFVLANSFTRQADHPLGPKWTLDPEPHLPYAPDDSAYLGSSVQPSCTQQPFIPPAQRPPPPSLPAPRAGSRYTTTPRRRTTSPRRSAPGEDADAAAALPAGVANLGAMGPARFYAALARSWVLVGMGTPSTSPTPYDALGLGVPFINLILTDPAHLDDRARWAAQHEVLKHLGPPHVSNVFKDDADGLGAGRAPS
ncbi:hypothetical protein DFH08DRAFT_785672 [Mycena albidolilacea]|uniref:Uncharacterized protein n=1 Tax=Mycena albidolilacea TaxID=1033008 RepID=A0AAD6ZPM3_9AGAR|nr:hypothetical protein DFH08DRAFT_785672 [Mycena albidolilacea]